MAGPAEACCCEALCRVRPAYSTLCMQQRCLTADPMQSELQHALK